jgi:hypothetical protein
MRTSLIAIIACLAAGPALAQSEPPVFKSTLLGHAILPAESFVDAPADAPDDLKTAAKFTQNGGRRVDAVGSVMGMDGVRPTGVKLPFKGQAVQGFSGIRSLGNNEFLVLTDNGFGSKANSGDAALMAHRLKIDFATGKVERLSTTFLSDPDKKVFFRIQNEGTKERYLTGADFDIESIQPIGDKLWFGDELGPYLIRTDRNGKVEAVFETLADGKPVRSPDHFAVTTPAAPTGAAVFNARRSKGFEGMAQSPDGKFLYAMLEGPLWDADKKAYETEGTEVLRVLEFDVGAEKWTGRFWKYPLAANGNAIGDFNMIDGTTALVLERDNGEGTADKACPAGEKKPDCFEDVAKFKRVFKVEFSDANQGGQMRKVGSIDLLAMSDPNEKARQGGKGGKLDFPFVTIENVDVVDRANGIIIVGNDNNLPFSAGRQPNKADDNEFVLLEVKDLLAAK